MQRWEAPLIIDTPLVVLGLYLAVRLGMVTNGTSFWALFPNDDGTVGAPLPDDVAIL